MSGLSFEVKQAQNGECQGGIHINQTCCAAYCWVRHSKNAIRFTTQNQGKCSGSTIAPDGKRMR